MNFDELLSNLKNNKNQFLNSTNEFKEVLDKQSNSLENLIDELKVNVTEEIKANDIKMESSKNIREQFECKKKEVSDESWKVKLSQYKIQFPMCGYPTNTIFNPLDHFDSTKMIYSFPICRTKKALFQKFIEIGYQYYDDFYSEAQELVRYLESKINLMKEGQTDSQLKVSFDKKSTIYRTDFIYIENMDNPSTIPNVIVSYISYLKTFLNPIFSLDKYKYILITHGDPMFSNYKKGAYYHPHLDNTKIKDNGRVITCILYLNKDWTEDKGGQLKVLEYGRVKKEKWVEPLFNRFLVFDSEDIYHEVAVNHDSRYAVTLWLYDYNRFSRFMSQQ